VSRRVRILLIVSLALNLFLAGLVASALVLGRNKPDERQGRRGPRAFWAAAEQLPEAKGDALRQRLKQQAQASHALADEVRAARGDAAEAMSREPYDPAAVNAALERARTQEVVLRKSFDESVVRFAAELTPAERRVLAEALRRRRGEPPHSGQRPR